MTAPKRRRTLRPLLNRSVGILVCLSPLWLIAASAIAATAGGSKPRPLGLAALVLALLLSGLNFYVSAIRPSRHLHRFGSMEGYRNVSPFPLLGSLLVIVGTLLGFGSWICVAMGLLALVLDLGGLPWFLIGTWRDESLWGE